jgi:hypothetical protein
MDKLVAKVLRYWCLLIENTRILKYQLFTNCHHYSDVNHLTVASGHLVLLKLATTLALCDTQCLNIK